MVTFTHFHAHCIEHEFLGSEIEASTYFQSINQSEDEGYLLWQILNGSRGGGGGGGRGDG